MWYLNASNTDEISADQIKDGDIIVFSTEPGHGSKITGVCNGRREGSKEVRTSGSRRTINADRKVLRLQMRNGQTVPSVRDANGR